MLYRFRAAMLAEEGLAVPVRGTERPTSIMAVTSLKEAEHWRQQVFLDISQKIMRIQNRRSNHLLSPYFHHYL
jgi:Isy1-like splicing family